MVFSTWTETKVYTMETHEEPMCHSDPLRNMLTALLSLKEMEDEHDECLVVNPHHFQNAYPFWQL